MMNKKGFVFVETIVVCAVLSISLVTVYAAFAMLVKNQKTRSNYDQAVYNYRSYYLVKYLNVITCDQEVSIDDDEIKNSLDITKAICVSADKLNDYKDDIDFGDYVKTIADHLDSSSKYLIVQFNNEQNENKPFYSHIIIGENNEA